MLTLLSVGGLASTCRVVVHILRRKTKQVNYTYGRSTVGALEKIQGTPVFEEGSTFRYSGERPSHEEVMLEH